ncbi:glutathione S-transferase 1-1-like [Pectinophora gossypiella]|uniref:glutathione S-transferase 1-1-like n=1 Tax=Pectinophora gossypiella TaxID=13191 RepID=UPI00214E4C07|nr:glutathione S-transferase 1-1-like [Pectinophora gossypiella]
MIELYYSLGSPPCGLVLMVLAALNITCNHHLVDMINKDQLKPEFVKLNPQHTVPTIVDDEFVLWESRAIARYLVNKYSEGHPLYPKDPKQRALIDQRLDFDLGTLNPSFTQYFYPPLLTGAPPKVAQLKKLEESLKYLDTFLEGNEYVTGPELTLADLALVVTVSLIAAAGVDLDPFSNVKRWWESIKNTFPGYKVFDLKCMKEFTKLIAEFKKVKSQLARSQSGPGMSNISDVNYVTQPSRWPISQSALLNRMCLLVHQIHVPEDPHFKLIKPENDSSIDSSLNGQSEILQARRLSNGNFIFHTQSNPGVSTFNTAKIPIRPPTKK